jgi:hypothetical protein
MFFLQRCFLRLTKKLLPSARASLIPPSPCPNSKPNARWRGSFSFVPSISVGFADNET